MTALLAPTERTERSRSTRHLQGLPRVPRRLSRVPFLVTLALLVAIGMAGVLVLNVSIQQRAAALESLQVQDRNLGYQQAALQTQVDQLSSTSGLMRQAYAAGMRPNPKPAFIQLPAGTIVGTPAPVTGSEMADQVPQQVFTGATATPSASGSAAASAKPATTKSATSAPASAKPPTTKPAATKPAATKAASTKPSTSTTKQASTTTTSAGGR